MSQPDAFFRFPHTPHLLWLAPGIPREDKLLSSEEARSFFESDVIVEEKVDGANLGFSVDPSGTLRAQNRGTYVDAHTHSQYAPLRRWMSEHQVVLVDALGQELILFGEWCVAVHSIEYTRLPDWFLAFDVFDRAVERFWPHDRRDAFCRRLGLAQVPVLARGRFEKEGLIGLMGPSKLGAPEAEGIYIRIDSADYLSARAKIVAARFQTAIGEHWSAKALRRNHLAGVPTGLRGPARNLQQPLTPLARSGERGAWRCPQPAAR